MNPILLPVVAAQAARAKRTTERLPPAAGPTTGVAPAAGGGSARLRLAVVGESTAAGCGAETHDDALAGQLARLLAERLRATVDWEAHGLRGATIHRINEQLMPRMSDGVDVAVLVAGVNDVFAGTPEAAWAENLAAAVSALGRRATYVLMSGMPPFRAIPALPRVLGRYLGERGDRVDQASRSLCAGTLHAAWLDIPEWGARQPGFFARDGFHPSSIGYRLWAEDMAQRIGQLLGPDASPRLSLFRLADPA